GFQPPDMPMDPRYAGAAQPMLLPMPVQPTSVAMTQMPISSLSPDHTTSPPPAKRVKRDSTPQGGGGGQARWDAEGEVGRGGGMGMGQAANALLGLSSAAAPGSTSTQPSPVRDGGELSGVEGAAQDGTQGGKTGTDGTSNTPTTATDAYGRPATWTDPASGYGVPPPGYAYPPHYPGMNPAAAGWGAQRPGTLQGYPTAGFDPYYGRPPGNVPPGAYGAPPGPAGAGAEGGVRRPPPGFGYGMYS
ncbi:hypothetical protein HDU93_009894, partial [Gonapodya sp. JEL0774]